MWTGKTLLLTVEFASELGIRINLEGREPQGIVTQDEYEPLRTRLINLFSHLQTPPGDPAFEFVKRREEIYDGPYLNNAPDIVFRPYNMNNVVHTGMYNVQFREVNSYNHDTNGVFIGFGSAFNVNQENKNQSYKPSSVNSGKENIVEYNSSIDPLSLSDIAPIALASAGFDVPTRMVGKVPKNLLHQPITRSEYEGVQYRNSVGSDESTGNVEDRLADLGYL